MRTTTNEHDETAASDETAEGAQLPTMSVTDLRPTEAARFRRILRARFPELDDEDEPLAGSDAVGALCELARDLDTFGADDDAGAAGAGELRVSMLTEGERAFVLALLLTHIPELRDGGEFDGGEFDGGQLADRVSCLVANLKGDRVPMPGGN